jgi:hypothetical protein
VGRQRLSPPDYVRMRAHLIWRRAVYECGIDRRMAHPSTEQKSDTQEKPNLNAATRLLHLMI